MRGGGASRVSCRNFSAIEGRGGGGGGGAATSEIYNSLSTPPTLCEHAKQTQKQKDSKR
eukprot:SAG11_NODE_2694_length_3083_cov_4.985255_5_plen_58_part_01